MKRTCRWLLILIGIALLGMTFSSPLSPYAARSVQHSWQLGHVLLFTVWTVLLFPCLPGRCSHPLLRLLLVIVAALVLGAVIEVLQTFVGREFSLQDLALDLIGSLLALCGLVAGGRLNIHHRSRRFLYSLTALLSTYAISPLAISAVDEINMYRHFPLLSSFDSALEAGRWRGRVKIVKLLTTRGESKALEISLDTRRYSGVSLAYFPGDWRAWQYLRFELFNPAQSPLLLTMRIHDDKHYNLGKGDYYDRFNRRLTLAPGWNSVSVKLADVADAPRNRTLDLANIQALGLFSVELPKPRVMYLDQIRLAHNPH